MTDALIGQIFDGRYRIERVLGTGGMGTVYLAHQLAMDRQVALKVMRSSLAQEPRTNARFQREARAAGRLAHPNIIRLYDFGCAEDGRLYMVCEYLEGETLGERLSRLGQLPIEEAVRVCATVADALGEAHRHGLVHRDLKPDNIFWVQSGGAETVKVLDFGLVKLVQGTDRLGNLTRTGVVGGTPRYMSPENAQGREVDGRSDIYSLGVLLYELLSGRPPFYAETTVATLLKHINEPVPPLRGVSGELSDVVYRCLEKEPDDRYEDAGGLATALRALPGQSGSAPAAEGPLAGEATESTLAPAMTDSTLEEVTLPQNARTVMVEPPTDSELTAATPTRAEVSPVTTSGGVSLMWWIVLVAGLAAGLFLWLV